MSKTPTTNNKLDEGGFESPTPLQGMGYQGHAGVQNTFTLSNIHAAFVQVGSSSAGADTDAGG